MNTREINMKKLFMAGLFVLVSANNVYAGGPEKRKADQMDGSEENVRDAKRQAVMTQEDGRQDQLAEIRARHEAQHAAQRHAEEAARLKAEAQEARGRQIQNAAFEKQTIMRGVVQNFKAAKHAIDQANNVQEGIEVLLGLIKIAQGYADTLFKEECCQKILEEIQKVYAEIICAMYENASLYVQDFSSPEGRTITEQIKIVASQLAQLLGTEMPPFERVSVTDGDLASFQI